MFRSVFTKSLRDLRIGVLGWGIGLGVLAVVTGAAWAKAYPDESSRLQLVQQIKGGLSAAQVFYGEPHALDTVGGFVAWRVLGLGPVLLGLYAILAATGMARGTEEGHTIEVVACTLRGRRRLLAQQGGALLAAIGSASALTGILLLAAGPAAGESAIAAGRAAGGALNLALAAALFGAVGLVTSQFFSRRRSAALLATAFMVAAHFVNTLPLVAPDLDPVRYISPLYLYSRSSPLADGGMDWAALAGLAVLVVFAFALALVLVGRRDVFDVVRVPRLWSKRTVAAVRHAGEPSGSPALRNAFTRALGDGVGSVIGWSVGLGLMATMLTAFTPNIRTALFEQATSGIAKQLAAAGLTSEKAIVSLLLFSILLPVVAVFAVTTAGGWAGDETSTRLELELATPVPRWQTFVERWLAAATVLTCTCAVLGCVIAAVVEIGRLDVPLTAIANGSWTLAVLAACVAAVGFAVAGWRPGAATVAGGTFVAVSYFANVLIPLFGLPHWVDYVSVFGLYGSPLVDGVGFLRIGAIALLTAALVGAGAWQFERRDVVK